MRRLDAALDERPAHIQSVVAPTHHGAIICLDNYRSNNYHGGMATVKARRALRFDSLEQEVFLGLWRTYDRLRAISVHV